MAETLPTMHREKDGGLRVVFGEKLLNLLKMLRYRVMSGRYFTCDVFYIICWFLYPKIKVRFVVYTVKLGLVRIKKSG